MAVIGNLTLVKDGGWTRNIRALTIDATLRLVPNDNREHDNAPACRAMIGWWRVGDAWVVFNRGSIGSAMIAIPFKRGGIGRCPCS